jgi:hypothetical protein
VGSFLNVVKYPNVQDGGDKSLDTTQDLSGLGGQHTRFEEWQTTSKTTSAYTSKSTSFDAPPLIDRRYPIKAVFISIVTPSRWPGRSAIGWASDVRFDSGEPRVEIVHIFSKSC